MVRAFNRAGASTLVRSDGFTIDSTGPSGGSALVVDGLNAHADIDFADVAPQALSATWMGFDEPDFGAGSISYRAGIGKCTMAITDVALLEVGTRTSYTFELFPPPPSAPPSSPAPPSPPLPGSPPLSCSS